MNKVIYKGKEYPTRTFNVICEGEERIYTIATEALSEAMGEEKEEWGTEAHDLDCQIYFYVEDEVIDLSPEEICKEGLDIEMEFVSEE